MRGYFPQSVSDYTKEQCQEYLENFPNGLNAESVKNRLELITNQSKENLQKCGKKSNSSESFSSNNTVTEDHKTATNENNAVGTNIWEVLGAIIVVIVVIVLSVLTWDWLKATFPVLALIIGIVYIIKSIFFND